MFPSSGLFADIDCPFSNHGLCERPHCLYKHATGIRDVFGASHEPSIFDFAGQCLETLAFRYSSRAPVCFVLSVAYNIKL